jgi:hypothetical protein
MKIKHYVVVVALIVLAALLGCYLCCDKPTEFKGELKPIIPFALDPENSNPNFAKSMGYNDEDRIITSVVEMAAVDAEGHIENTPQFLKINNVSLPLMAAQIDTAAINQLKEIASGLSCNPVCTRSITGVRITYGAIGNNLKLYYTPVLFCFIKKAGTGGHLGELNNYTLCREGVSYVYNGGPTFVPADAAEMNAATMSYTRAQTGLRIRRIEASGIFDNFKAEATIFGDVTSSIFSFQQIEKIYRVPMPNLSVKIWNTLGVFPLQPSSKYPLPLLKHTLLFSSGYVTNNGNDLLVTQRPFSNLSHICPPNCITDAFWFMTVPQQ